MTAIPPINLVASMVLDNGSRWGDCATPDQWADMRALLSPERPRWHFWLRARGRSKTLDSGAATLATMLSGEIRAGDEMYAAAEDRTQAGLLAEKIRGIGEATPELRGAAEVQQFRVITPRTGAMLNVLSSELAGSWGKTPRWLFIDEICNHGATRPKAEFIDALLTALVKRRDSVCLIGSTPSAPTHWAHAHWQHAVKSGLWRASIVKGAAPWQDPEELADLAAKLPEYMWRRLFDCEWCAAEGALTDEEALSACTRDGVLGYVPGTSYVVTYDLGLTKDHAAVAVAHTGAREGKKTVVIDRLYGWIPPKGGQVDLDDVLGTAAALSREFGGAPLVGDPWQAWLRMQELQRNGYQVRPVNLTAGAVSKRAQALMRLVRDRALSIPDDEDLRTEFLSLRLAEGATPGVVHLVSDGSSQGHFDRVTAVAYAAEELLSRPGESWRDYCGTTKACEPCGRVYLVAMKACPFCRALNPEATSAAEPVREGSILAAPNPGSWASAYLPPDARQCARGHVYAGSHGDRCPRCEGGSGFRPGGSLPQSLMAVLGRR